MTAIAEQSRSTTPPKFWVLLTTSLISSLIMLDSNIVAVSLPTMGRTFGASFTDIQWIVSAYVLTYAALLMATGNFADLYGRRKAMLLGLGAFAVVSFACAVAPTALLLNLARAAQGFGGALLLTSALAIISREFAGTERAGAFAFWGAALGNTPPDGKGAIRGTFSAIEGLFRLMFGTARLGAAELETLAPVLQRLYTADGTALRTSNKMLASFKA
jgi:MFS family permease